jgi:hypothetical protein
MAESTNFEVRHYAVFSSLILFCLTSVQIILIIVDHRGPYIIFGLVWQTFSEIIILINVIEIQ